MAHKKDADTAKTGLECSIRVLLLFQNPAFPLHLHELCPPIAQSYRVLKLQEVLPTDAASRLEAIA